MSHDDYSIDYVVSTLNWHRKLVRLNQDAITHEYLCNDPDADKIAACREEIWFHSFEVDKHINILLPLYVAELYNM